MGGYPGYYICAPISHLWTSYPIQVQLEDIASHLEVKGRLSNGSWTGVPTTATPLTEWFTQTPVLKHFCLIFNDIQSFVHGEHQSDTTIVYAGPSKPPHLQSATAYPEAMLVVKGKVGKERSWADLICPFESAYHPRCIERVSALPIFGEPSLTKRTRARAKYCGPWNVSYSVTSVAVSPSASM